MYSENHMILIKDIDKDKNTWKDILVLDLEELVFENVNTTQKLLKIQGDFQWLPQSTLSSINRWVSFIQQKILRAKMEASWRNSTCRLQHRNSEFSAFPVKTATSALTWSCRQPACPTNFQISNLPASTIPWGSVVSLSLSLSKHTHIQRNTCTHPLCIFLSFHLVHLCLLIFLSKILQFQDVCLLL